ncbi:MAG: YraN family protein [Clostridia bacterium]|nr:YraN family protein [Clostridia bacterium]
MNIGATGGVGEDAALEMLLKNGFELVVRNYQTKYGEIDLIVKNERFLVFVEVKTRTKASRYKGFVAVTNEKKQKIFKTAFTFLRDNNLRLQPRIDVIDVEGHWFVMDEREQFAVDDLRWYKNAITSNDYNGFL